MKIIKSTIIFLFLFSSTIVSSQESYNVFTLKNDGRGHIGLDVGTLNSKHIYTGIQGTIPTTSYTSTDEYTMNAACGYGGSFIFKSNFILSGILGIHTADGFDTFGTKNINAGGGFTVLTSNVVVFGFSYTNREKFAAKIGFYICRY